MVTWARAIEMFAEAHVLGRVTGAEPWLEMAVQGVLQEGWGPRVPWLTLAAWCRVQADDGMGSADGDTVELALYCLDKASQVRTGKRVTHTLSGTMAQIGDLMARCKSPKLGAAWDGFLKSPLAGSEREEIALWLYVTDVIDANPFGFRCLVADRGPRVRLQAVRLGELILRAGYDLQHMRMLGHEPPHYAADIARVLK
jgi:hypothetical protein